MKEGKTGVLASGFKNKYFWFWVTLLPLWVLWKNIFPSTHYFFHKNVGNGLRITEKKIQDKRYVLIPAEREGLIGQLKVRGWFETGEKMNEKIFLAKNYEVALYPVGQAVQTEDQLKEILFWGNPSRFPNGTLLADDRAVYVVSEGKLRPFISPEVFERLGFVWEKIFPERTPPELPMGESLNLQAVHPEGTILKDRQNNFFVFFQGLRRPVSEELLRKVWPEFFWIDLGETSVRFFADCSSRESWFGRKTVFDCRFDLKNETALANVFILDVSELEGNKLLDVRSVAVSSFRLDPARSLALFVEKTRGRLALQYGFLKKL